MLDLIIKNAHLENGEKPVNIGILKGKIDSISIHTDASAEAKNTYDACGQFICSGFYESHIPLNKACILDRCSIEEGTLDEAVQNQNRCTC